MKLRILKSVVIIFGLLSLVGFSTNSYFSDTVTIGGNEMIAGEWAIPEPSPGALVINEINYDQTGTDTDEFIELKNVGGSVTNLSEYAILIINGSGTGSGLIDKNIPLPSFDLAAGDYFVLCANSTITLNCDFDVTPDSNLIQNGGPDAVALIKIAGGSIVDTVSYEGDTIAPYTEGTGVGLIDPSNTIGESISRLPDGIDTNNNFADFHVHPFTPGTANL